MAASRRVRAYKLLHYGTVPLDSYDQTLITPHRFRHEVAGSPSQSNQSKDNVLWTVEQTSQLTKRYLPDSQPTCPDGYNEELWNRRIVIGDTHFHMFLVSLEEGTLQTTPGINAHFPWLMDAFILKVSGDGEWVYEDMDDDPKRLLGQLPSFIRQVHDLMLLAYDDSHLILRDNNPACLADQSGTTYSPKVAAAPTSIQAMVIPADGTNPRYVTLGTTKEDILKPPSAFIDLYPDGQAMEHMHQPLAAASHLIYYVNTRLCQPLVSLLPDTRLCQPLVSLLPDTRLGQPSASLLPDTRTNYWNEQAWKKRAVAGTKNHHIFFTSDTESDLMPNFNLKNWVLGDVFILKVSEDVDEHGMRFYVDLETYFPSVVDLPFDLGGASLGGVTWTVKVAAERWAQRGTTDPPLLQCQTQ